MFRHAKRLAPIFVLQSAGSVFGQSIDQIEPRAGTWKTWAISSAEIIDWLRPPDAASTRGELESVRGAIAEKDPRIAQQVSFWDAGAPSYRWIDLISNRFISGAPVTAFGHRLYAYVAMAMYDTTVAVWDSKYAYNRPRPSAVDPTLRTRLPTPRSPSYPSEHSATAPPPRLPCLAISFRPKPRGSRAWRRRPVNRGCTPGWNFQPITSRGWSLDAVFTTNERAFYWQSADGLRIWPYRHADKWMAEDKLHENPPRAARVYALIALAFFDTFIASQDGKFTYWYIRPHQLDSAIVPIFPAPNFPSYPSNHSSFSATNSEMLAYLFPTRADYIRAVGKEAGDSRIWAGIHYQIDNEAGVRMGRSVAQKFIAWANADGSQ